MHHGPDDDEDPFEEFFGDGESDTSDTDVLEELERQAQAFKQTWQGHQSEWDRVRKEQERKDDGFFREQNRKAEERRKAEQAKPPPEPDWDKWAEEMGWDPRKGRPGRQQARPNPPPPPKPPAPKPASPYTILGVSPTASFDTIRSAYLALMRKCHPDLVGEKGTEQAKILNNAMDEIRRMRGK